MLGDQISATKLLRPIVVDPAQAYFTACLRRSFVTQTASAASACVSDRNCSVH